MVQAFWLFTFLLLCAGCEPDEGNRRGYVISQTHELPAAEDIPDLAQP